MNIFKTWSLTWSQTAIFKLALLLVGIAIGAYWSNVFHPYAGLLALVGIVLALYIAFFVWGKQ